jgi:protein-L-isoaspartate(D-aspartate) O-methyltransferase
MSSPSPDLVEQRVQAAFDAVPRAPFLPRRKRRFAADDRPIEIGHGQTNSQPRTVRAMLELLDVSAGQRVLDVGCGSGWTTALLAALTGPTGSVLGLEIVPALVELARRNLSAVRTGVDVSVRQADPDVLGAPEQPAYDKILVSAQAAALPDPLVEQLAVGGRMVVPVRGVMTVVTRDDSTHVDVSEHGRYAFVPLIWTP